MKELVNVILVNFFLVDELTLAIERVTGVFGPNGSGKSSVLDAIQIAMMGANGNQISLNAQADDKSVRRSPRRIRDYVLGRYGVEEGEEAREDATCYITLVFRDTLTNEMLSMGVCIHAQRGREDHEVLGRYVLPGVALSLSDHVSRSNDETTPLDWPTFTIHLERKAKVGRLAEYVYASSDRYQEAYLLALRSSEGRAQLEAFRKSFRFALRMRFDESVEDIVKNQILEAKPVDIKRFKEVVNTFGRLRDLVTKTEDKIKAARGVKQHFDRAIAEARKATTLKALAQDAIAELAMGRHNDAVRELNEATEAHDAKRDELDALSRRKSLAEEEANRLDVLISSHAAHQTHGIARSQLREKETALTRARDGFGKGVTLLSRLLDSTAADPDLSQLAASLSQHAQRVKDMAPDLQRGDEPREDVERSLAPAVAAAAMGFRALGSALSQAEAMKADKQGYRERLQNNITRLQQGRAALSDGVQKIQRALDDHGVKTEPVCDLVRVSDPEWQLATESYLGPNREALLILRVDQEATAFDIYRAYKGVYGVKLALASQNSVLQTPTPGTVAELLVGESTPAVMFLRSLLGSTARATDSGAVKKQRALTADGMLVSNGALERLRPAQSLLLGGVRSNPEEITRIAREIEVVKRDIKSIERRIEDLHQLQSQLGIFADPKRGLGNLLGGYDTLLAAKADVESLRSVLEQEADAEYTGLVAQQGNLRAQVAAMEQDVTALSQAVGRASERVEVLTREAARRAEEAESARTAATAAREEPYFDAQMALTDWEALDRMHSGNFGSMSQAADERSQLAARASNNAVLRGNTDLTTFALSFAEHPPQAGAEEDPDATWRRAAAWIDDLIVRLEGTDLVSYRKQVDDAYRTAQDTFRNDVAVKIHESLDYMSETIEKLNAVLRTCPAFSNGERYAFHKKLKSEYTALYHFIQGVGAGADTDMFEDSAKVPPEFRALIEQSTEPGAAGTKTPLQDYREFFQFDIEIMREEPGTRTLKRVTFLSKRLGPSSGGEHRAPLYVIAGAALASAYRITKGGTSGLRLMLLDEAFDKMDDTNTISTLQYLEDLGLQVVMAGPGKDLGVLNAFLYRYYEVSRDPVNQAMSFAGHSLSKAARDLNRSDRFEFNPDLLDAEIRAMEAVEKPVKTAAPA